MYRERTPFDGGQAAVLLKMRAKREGFKTELQGVFGQRKPCANVSLCCVPAPTDPRMDAGSRLNVHYLSARSVGSPFGLNEIGSGEVDTFAGKSKSPACPLIS